MDLQEGTINKKVRNAQLAQINYMAVVGKLEQETGQVDLRDRDQKNPLGKFTIDKLIELFKSKLQPPSVSELKMAKEAYTLPTS